MNDNDKGIYENSCEVSSLCTVTLYTALIRVHCDFAIVTTRGQNVISKS